MTLGLLQTNVFSHLKDKICRPRNLCSTTALLHILDLDIANGHIGVSHILYSFFDCAALNCQ